MRYSDASPRLHSLDRAAPASLQRALHAIVIYLRSGIFLTSILDLGRVKPPAGFQRRVVSKVAEDVINVDIVDLDNGITNVLVSGRMDVQGALAVDKKFSTIADEKKKVVIDLSQVTFLASLGIRTLIMSCKTLASKGGDMVLLNPQPNVEKVLRTSGVDTVIQIVRDMNAATAIFNK
jgi:anti-anti-sigma factor